MKIRPIGGLAGYLMSKKAKEAMKRLNARKLKEMIREQKKRK